MKANGKQPSCWSRYLVVGQLILSNQVLLAFIVVTIVDYGVFD